MASAPKSSTTSASTDALFRRIVVISTALCLAITYGWLGCFARTSDGDVVFRWQWAGLIWFVIGYATTVYFWRKIWPAKNRPARTRKEIVRGSIVLALPGLWWITLPMHFMSGQHFGDVMDGLIAAAIVLSFGAWMVLKLIKAFEAGEAKNSSVEISPAKSEE